MAKPAFVAIVKPGCSQLEQKKFDDIFYIFFGSKIYIQVNVVECRVTFPCF